MASLVGMNVRIDRSVLLAIGLIIAGLCRAFQQELSAPATINFKLDLNATLALGTDISDLNAPSTDPYARLTHPVYPNHTVRVKQTRFCDGIVSAYTGYIDVEARHLFFYFFESRRDPDADDVVFWTNGGPGGSSATGLFMENGEWMTSANTTERFEHSWNAFANVMFVDQPVGTGFSYADYGEQVSSTHEAAEDIAAFVAVFFHHFSRFSGRKFHMAGESYGGRMIPVYASAVYDQNERLVRAGLEPINLASIILGNGCTDFLSMTRSYYDIQCVARPEFDLPPVQNIAECVRMRQHVPRCEQHMKSSCIDAYDEIDCLAAVAFCQRSFQSFFVDNGGYNPHDRSRPCKPYRGMPECYPAMKDIQGYLNDPEIQTVLGVDPEHGSFVWHSESVQAAFERHADRVSFHSERYIGALLERGVRALVYVGVNDFVCNWIGNERMTFKIEWTAQEAYRSAAFREWVVRGKEVVAGKVRSGGGLTFTTILDAGHLTPYDQPLRTSEVVRRWLDGREI